MNIVQTDYQEIRFGVYELEVHGVWLDKKSRPEERHVRGDTLRPVVGGAQHTQASALTQNVNFMQI